MSRELLFSVSIKDCKVEALKCSKGAGGQHRDKTSSAQRVTHEPSGAVGFSQEYREQPKNKRLAFKRMVETPEFQAWHRVMIAEMMGRPSIQSVVDEQMDERNIRVEFRTKNGKWQTEEVRQ